MNMDDIKFFVAERSNRPQRAGQIWGDGSDRTVSEGGDTRAQRRNSCFRGRPIARTQDSHLVSEPVQCSGKRENLTLNPSGDAEAIWRDDSDSHIR